MSKYRVATAFGVGSLVISIGVAILIHRKAGQVSRYNYEQVSIGMDLAEVSALLGRGESVTRLDVPGIVDDKGEIVPVVYGDKIFVWPPGARVPATCIFIGLKNGRVCSKYYCTVGL